MAGFTKYLSNKLLNHTFRKESFTYPTNVYIGLFTTATNADGGGTEVSAGNYARAECTGSTKWDSSTAGATANSAEVSWPTPNQSWGSVGWFGIFDAITGGNMICYGALTVAKTIDSGDIVKANAGDLDITLS